MEKGYLHYLLKTFYCALFFFVALIWTPFTRELFEFPKMLAVYFFTAWIGLLFIVKSLLSAELKIKKTFLDIPVLIFLFVYALATLLSIHFPTSFLGYYTRFHGGFLSLLCYVLLFYIFITEFDNFEPFLSALFFSAALVSVWGVLEHFGIDKDYWAQDVQSRVFSTLGQPNWLASFLAMLIPVSLAWGAVLIREGKFKVAIFLAFLSFLYYLAFWFTYSLSGLVGLIGGIFLLLFFARGRLNFLQKRYLLALVCCFVLFSILFPGLFKARLKQIKDILVNNLFTVYAQIGQMEHSGSTTSIRLLVWEGAWNTFLAKPLLGHGPETFAYSFLPHRPAGLNFTDEWDFLYNKSHNEYLDLLCNTGVFGLVFFLLLASAPFYYVFKSGPEKFNLAFGLLGGIFCYLVSNFFGFSVVVTGMLFWFYLGLTAISTAAGKEFRKISLSNIAARFCISVGTLVLFLVFLLFIFRAFWADVSYARGLSWEAQGSYLQAAAGMKKATLLNNSWSAYFRDLADNLAQAALAEQAAVAEADESTATSLAAWSHTEAQKAYKKNSLNSLTLKTLTKTYYNLSFVDSAYLSYAEKIGTEMVSLSPTDPKAYYNLGLVYYVSGNDEEARTALEKAVQLRPQYAEAAELLEELK